jgi:hypothetical protein
MARNLGKPSGKFAEKKTSPGRKSSHLRSGWPEEAPTQRTDEPRSREHGGRQGRNQRAGGGK